MQHRRHNVSHTGPGRPPPRSVRSGTSALSTASSSTWGHSGAPSSVTWHDPEADLSFAFYNNGYPATGYDLGRSGRNRRVVVSTLGGDLIDD